MASQRHVNVGGVQVGGGAPVVVQTMERAGFVGFALVIALFVIGLTNDIGRLTGEGFGVR